MADTHPMIWGQVNDHLENSLNRLTYLTWFKPLRCLSTSGNTIIIGVPNDFHQGFLVSHYHNKIMAVLRELAGDNFEIHYQLVKDSDSPSIPTLKEEPQTVYKPDKSFDERTQLNQRYTFDNFVEGNCNTFARTTALAVAEAPGKTAFNPLFIYGLTGLGKTHLAQAIGNFSLANNKKLRVLYATSEKFVNDLIYAIREYKTTDFSRIYRSMDLLLIDDVQFFLGKGRSQLEFFHTFNSLYQAGKQIVLTSDRPPNELDDFDQRLIGRIGQGLVADIQPPDYETRLAILQRRAEADHLSFSEDIYDFIAAEFKDNIRELEASLTKLYAFCTIINRDITLEDARSVLKDQIKTSTAVISIEHIRQKVAEYHKISEDLLIARNRKKEVARARQIAMFLCTVLTKSSLMHIGLHFGNRDYSTVIHARDTISREIDSNPVLAREIELLKGRILSL